MNFSLQHKPELCPKFKSKVTTSQGKPSFTLRAADLVLCVKQSNRRFVNFFLNFHIKIACALDYKNTIK